MKFHALSLALMLIALFGILPAHADSSPTTLYLCGDSHTVHDVTAYRLNETLSGDSKIIGKSRSGNLNVYWGIRIYILNENGETEITDGISAVVNRTADGQGIQSCNLTVSHQILILAVSALKLNVYTKIGEDGDWQLLATFISDPLSKTAILSGEWTIEIYTRRYSTGSETYSYIYFGGSYQSKISNIQLEEPDIFDWMSYKLRTGQLINFIILPYINLIKDIFYGLMLLLICIPVYNRYHSFTPILIIFVIFGGTGGIISLLIPQSGLQIAWILLVIGLAGLIYKALR